MHGAVEEQGTGSVQGTASHPVWLGCWAVGKGIARARRPSKKDCFGASPGSAVVENPPSNEEDEGPIPG